MLQRQGQMGPDGAPVAADARKRQAATQEAARRTTRRERTKPMVFLREVRGELRRVAWPTRAEVVNYSMVVLLTLIVLIAAIFVLDLLFAKSILFLFDTPGSS
jgi:preprotein translocase subunit SecE